MINLTKKYNIGEIRKKYSKAGMKWAAGDDELLKKLYMERKPADVQGLNSLILELSAQFGRAAGGLKARLARHFSDVPGWDYGRDRFRKQALDKPAQRAITPARDELPRAGYGKYLETKIDFDFSQNPEAQAALKIMAEGNGNLFLTGEAGTGKSSLLQYFRCNTEKNIVVLAPTGVAALNVRGQTIHSFFGFGPDVTLQKIKKFGPGSGKFQLLQKLHTIIIDEISMVLADLVDCVDKFLRLNGPSPDVPFGGIQMVFIGDLYQLPPVDKHFGAGDGLIKIYNSPYFFDSRAFKQSKFHHAQLKQIYRQRDVVFIDVLNAVRRNEASEEHLAILNQRALYRSEAAGKGGAQTGRAKFIFEKFAIYLTPHNAQASKVNNFFLEKLSPPLKIYDGIVRGSFEDREPPTDLHLQIKIGAQVMMLNNDQGKRWVNGTMGKVVGIEAQETDASATRRFIDAGAISGFVREPDNEGLYFRGNNSEQGEFARSDSIIIELETGQTVYVQPHTWEIFQFVFDKRSQNVDSRTSGTFTQYPFKLAWAVTIHKAQGKTFDKIYIDLSAGTFAHGQLYVALSRCRTLQGLYLKRPITQADIILDNRIVRFLQSLSNPDSPTESLRVREISDQDDFA